MWWLRRNQLIIWGAGGHALTVAEVVRSQRQYEIAGFLDDVNHERHNEKFCGARILGGAEKLDDLRAKGINHLILGIGDCHMRLKLSGVARHRGFSLVTIMHPRASIAKSARVGPGTFLADGAVVCPGSVVGESVIINTCASVDHECIIEDGAHISPGVHLGGKVRVGRAAWIGIGATVVENARVGPGALVGAGAVVVKDIPPGVLAYGTPARVICELGSMSPDHSLATYGTLAVCHAAVASRRLESTPESRR